MKTVLAAAFAYKLNAYYARKAVRLSVPRSLILSLAVTLMACGQPSSPSPAGIQVTRAQYGDRWPFTIESGYLDCIPPGAVVFRSQSGAYAVNGLAESRGFADVDPIWRDDPVNPGLKINIGPMIDLGLQQCH